MENLCKRSIFKEAFFQMTNLCERSILKEGFFREVNLCKMNTFKGHFSRGQIFCKTKRCIFKEAFSWIWNLLGFCPVMTLNPSFDIHKEIQCNSGSTISFQP